MENQHFKLNNIVYKVKSGIKSVIGICILLSLLYISAEIFPSLRTVKGQLVFGFIILIVLLTSSIILGKLDDIDIRSYIKDIKIYGIKQIILYN